MIPVKIKNRDDRALFGILDVPNANIGRRDCCIVFLSPGVKSRVAPHRLYLKMARSFVAMGFMVLRFDFSGLGDSEGENDEANLVDLYSAVQLGKYVNDTIDVMTWMEENHQQKQFILAGLCGGAITGMHAGVQDRRVIALLSIGMPVVLDGHAIDKRLYLTPRQLEDHRSSFLHKAFNLEAWKRLFFLQSDYKLLYLSFMVPVLKKIRSKRYDGGKRNGSAMEDNLNPLFHPHFSEFARTRKILLAFGESDKLLWDFQEKYLLKYRAMYAKLQNNVDLRIIKDANHILSFQEWTRQVVAISKDWLERTIAAPAAERTGQTRDTTPVVRTKA